MAVLLTSFGEQLSKASRLRAPDLDSSFESWRESYIQNGERVKALKAKLSTSPNVVILGAGKSDYSCLPLKKEGWLYFACPWLSFTELELDGILSNHTCLLEAAMHARSGAQSPLFIQSSVSEVPPIYKDCLSIQWSNVYAQCPTGTAFEDVAKLIIDENDRRNGSLLPLALSVPNIIFVLANLLITLGAKKLVFSGVDPLNPSYFFTGNTDMLLAIAQSLAKCDPWIAEWDGLSTRLPMLHRDSSNRLLNILANTLQDKGSAMSAKYRINWMKEGFEILKREASLKEVELSYVGFSQFLSSISLPSADP